jgi:hypothetical protein
MPGTAPPSQEPSEARLHLILVYFPDLLDPADFYQIADFVRAKAPDIEPFVIVDSMDPAAEIEARATSKPFLLFAPVSLKRFRPTGGKIYAGHGVPKLDQLERLKRAGIPIPKWTLITPNTKLSAADWGPVVIVKPTAGSLSAGVELRLTESVRYRVPLSYPANHPARQAPMIAQKFIDSGRQTARIRVLTLFGEPLYAEEVKDADASEWPAVLDEETVKTITVTPVKAKKRIRSFVHDQDVLDLARRTYRLYPEIPLHACDIMREESSGKLYILELNLGGNTWHFSSKVGRRELVEGKKRWEQFNAFEVAAELLIERTRKEAK